MIQQIKIKKIKKQSLPVMLKKAQATFNLFIRLRDKDKRCVACGCGKIQHASHFYSAGKFSALRFNEDNVHGSCLQSNYFDHGGLIGYRTELLKRIGPDKLAMLESTATRERLKKWSRFELETLINIYRDKIKELKK